MLPQRGKLPWDRQIPRLLCSRLQTESQLFEESNEHTVSPPIFPRTHKAPHWKALTVKRMRTVISVCRDWRRTENAIGLRKFLSNRDGRRTSVIRSLDAAGNGKCNERIESKMLQRLDQFWQIGLPESKILCPERSIPDHNRGGIRRVIESHKGVVNDERSNLCQDNFSNNNVDIAKIVRRDNDSANRRSKTDYPSASIPKNAKGCRWVRRTCTKDT